VNRIIVWIDSADEDVTRVRKRLKDYLAKAGLSYTIFENCEIMESEIE
jgi:hypothetical protein